MKQMTEDNFLLCAMKSYDNPSCGGMEEFKEDLNRVKYVKRLLNRYIKTENQKGKKLFGGIVINTKKDYQGRWIYFDSTSIDLKDNDFDNWKDLEL